MTEEIEEKCNSAVEEAKDLATEIFIRNYKKIVKSIGKELDPITYTVLNVEVMHLVWDLFEIGYKIKEACKRNSWNKEEARRVTLKEIADFLWRRAWRYEGLLRGEEALDLFTLPFGPDRESGGRICEGLYLTYKSTAKELYEMLRLPPPE
jgi:hypothetical protein